MKIRILSVALPLLLLGCGDSDDNRTALAETADVQGIATTGDWDSRLSQEELAQGRLAADWRQVVEFDSAALAMDSMANPEQWDQISMETVNQTPMQLPLHGDVAGPSVLRTQVLLDRALFSPGIIDGKWGKNTEKAIYWFQQREGLGRTGVMDQQTFERLVQVGGAQRELVRTHRLTAEDVEGPFMEIPEDIYDKAEMECMCYESLSEKLGELFHTSPELLEKLNPNVDLASLSAGDPLNVPNVREATAGQNAQIAKLIVSAQGFYVHAVDASDRIIFHFPTTMGSSYDPSPSGDHSVTRITPDPWWHYQPDILEHVPDDEADAKIPPGPNNAVGVVWMALSIPHYGIHGTSAPETIGYTTSAGCVRLTNWDALFLSERIAEGVDVSFTEGRAAAAS